MVPKVGPAGHLSPLKIATGCAIRVLSKRFFRKEFWGGNFLMDAATAKLLCSVRHFCFVRGILGDRKKGGQNQPPEDDFRQAFRTVNRLYVQARRGIELEGQVYPHRSVGAERKGARQGLAA